MKHLLIGSAQDNFPGSNIFDATKKLAALMTATPGTGLFLSNTGHSVHFERPRFLAGEIADFLPWDETPKQEPTEVLSLEITDVYREIMIFRRRPRYGRILAVTRNEPHEERAVLIDGGRSASTSSSSAAKCSWPGPTAAGHGVHVVRKRGARPYIATAPDASGDNNLLSLAG